MPTMIDSLLSPPFAVLGVALPRPLDKNGQRRVGGPDVQPVIKINTLIDRLEVAAEQVNLTPQQWGRLLLTLLPELYDEPDEPDPPAEPTEALPGSSAKKATLESRAAAGLALWHPDDADPLRNDRSALFVTMRGGCSPHECAAPVEEVDEDAIEEDIESKYNRKPRGWEMFKSQSKYRKPRRQKAPKPNPEARPGDAAG